MTQDTDQMTALDPLTVARDGGEARWWFGTLAVIKTTAAETNGQLTIVDVTNPPGMEAPLHVHYRDDEGFWILEGSATIEVGDTTIEANAGDYVFGPRNIPHRYTVGDSGCRMLFIMVPGGMEEVIRATSEPAASLTVPPPADEEPDMEAIKAIVKAHGYELLD
jgi:mannose-6-phosphate isomerase-like protein (cupin superfamily)